MPTRLPPVHLLVLVAWLTTACGSVADAQANASPDPVPVRPSPAAAPELRVDPLPPPPAERPGVRSWLSAVADDFAHLPSWENLDWTFVGGSLTAAAYTVDNDVNQHLAGNPGLFRPGRTLGQGYTQVAVAAAAYVYGSASHRPRVAHVGMDLLRAQIVAGALTYGLKLAVRRERPDGSDNMSFPSGHATVTFATAAVLQRHFGWWSLPAFLVASYTATSRLHDNVHYLSDVVAGAAVGMIAGRTVTRDGHSRFAFVPVVAPGHAAFMVVRLAGR